MPRTTPRIIDRTLISRVRPAPARTVESNSLSPTALHWIFSAVANALTSSATSASTTTALTYRP